VNLSLIIFCDELEVVNLYDDALQYNWFQERQYLIKVTLIHQSSNFHLKLKFIAYSKLFRHNQVLFNDKFIDLFIYLSFTFEKNL
jgi:hypothetical protein